MSKGNGKITCERYQGVLLVYAPAVKWYHLSVPYSSEMERILAPARNFEERAVVVAPDKITAMMMKLESFGPQIMIVQGLQEAKRWVDGNPEPSRNGYH